MWKELIQLFKKDNLFEQAYQEAAGMLDTDAAMYDASVEALRRSDTAEVKFDIYDADKGVNRSVVIDIERIGDYTKNIYDLAVHHPLRLEGGPVEDKLQKVEALVSSDFKSMIEVFKDRDEDKARLIMNSYKDGLSDACEEISNSILTGTVTGLNSSDATAVSLYARFLKRIASHSRNIVSSVVNPFHRIGYREK